MIGMLWTSGSGGKNDPPDKYKKEIKKALTVFRTRFKKDPLRVLANEADLGTGDPVTVDGVTVEPKKKNVAPRHLYLVLEEEAV